jgi:hypothetical protein
MPPPDDQPAAPDTGRSPFAEQLCVPQFGILRILLLTAVTAVLLKLNLALSDDLSRARLSEAYRWGIKIMQSLWAIVFAADLVGSGVLIRARCYKMFSRLQPGHWIVLVTALSGVLWLVVWPVSRLLGQEASIWVSTIVEATFGLPIAFAFLYAAVRLRDGWRWKILLSAKGLGAGAAAITAALSLVVAVIEQSGYPNYRFLGAIYSASVFWSVVLLILLFLAAVIDLLRWASRDWLHWLGVATLCLSGLITIGWWIASFWLVSLSGA